MINVYALDDKNVELPLSYYEELIIKAQRYDDIVAAALSGAEIPAWRDEIQLDTDAVEDYLKIVEMDKVTKMENKLKIDKEIRIAEAQEAAE